MKEFLVTIRNHLGHVMHFVLKAPCAVDAAIEAMDRATFDARITVSYIGQASRKAS